MFPSIFKYWFYEYGVWFFSVFLQDVVVVRVTVIVVKHHEVEQLGVERVYLELKLDWNLEARADAEAMEEY